MTALEGGCACGQVRYKLKSAPMFVHCCHCCDCQRQTGSAFVINALIETDRVERLAGETEGVPVPAPSGRPHVIHRCPVCKVALWSHYGGRSQLSFVRSARSTNPPRFRPTSTSTPARSCRGSSCPRTFPRSKSITTRKTCGRPRVLRGARRCSG
ncbi:MAG TPA: GFA family protein, partial [Roseiarcus sp.]|nr:GFA family protein [Roseiarcus sp.]